MRKEEDNKKGAYSHRQLLDQLGGALLRVCLEGVEVIQLSLELGNRHRRVAFSILLLQCLSCQLPLEVLHGLEQAVTGRVVRGLSIRDFALQILDVCAY